MIFPFNNETLFKILWVIIVSFFSSFAKELNDKAKDPKESFLLFVSETLLNGISGFVIGILLFSITDNLFAITAGCAIGGITGVKLLTYITKFIILYISMLKNVNIDKLKDVDIDNKEDNDKNNST